MVAQYHRDGLDARSIARILSTWRGFFRWLIHQGLLTTSPADVIKLPKRAQSLPRALTVEQAIHLVATPATRTFSKTFTCCNHAMFELLYSSGLRVSELVSIDDHFIQYKDYQSMSWFDPREREVIITGKGNKRRHVPVGRAAQEAIWFGKRFVTNSNVKMSMLYS